ncbi:MAG: acetoin:2,6-dichlorophenolindophenol oxidoreductase subunit beta [Chloroflexota bacterium]|nr:acetoin:2,6-dichlorophenolindophenol oxidoreductase subunit beta [Chloroflexota bacterium]
MSLRANANVSELIAATMELELARDPRTLLLGEDVGYSGGTFGASRRLFREYGEWRVRDTPISEMGFTGMAVGLALSGWRPIVELMFVDFIGVCLEQVYNAIAKNRYMSGGMVGMPITIRAAGGCIGVAAQHSQTLWGMLAHLPGLKVVAPSNPYDYKGLLAASIEDDDPVVFIEHKDAYLRPIRAFPLGAEVPDERYTVALGQAAIVRPGSDITVATLSTMVVRSLAAADTLAGEGLDVEVVDLRTVVPLDHDTVVGSVARTGRLLVVDEDYHSFGLSGELLARTFEALGPGGLRGARRLAVPDVPIPAAKSLEDVVIPSVAAIAAACRSLALDAGR